MTENPLDTSTPKTPHSLIADAAADTRHWWRGATSQQWHAFGSAYLGWMLDVMDLMLFSMVIKFISTDLKFSISAAGSVVSATLLTTAIGGIFFGLLADRLGRAQSMSISILCYSVGTLLCGFSTSLSMLIVFRIIVGLGIGGQWSAGSALVSETWPAVHRGKVMAWVQSAFAAGYALAAIIAAVVIPLGGWRWVFVMGFLPVVLTLYVRRHVKEPEIWSNQTRHVTLRETVQLLFSQHGKATLFASVFTTFAMCGYWGLFTWIPTYLSTPIADGGSGLNLVKSTIWIVVMQIGAALGYISFGYLADKIGRKYTFVLFFICSALSVPLFVSTKNPELLMAIGIVVSYFGTGFYSGFAPTFAELFPTAIRATAQGFVYNISRAISALSPALIGFLASRYSIHSGLLVTSVFFILAAFIVWLFIPETKGMELS